MEKQEKVFTAFRNHLRTLDELHDHWLSERVLDRFVQEVVECLFEDLDAERCLRILEESRFVAAVPPRL